MHINAETIYIEIIGQNGKPTENNEIGEIVITDLLNIGMPLVRYKIKDVGTFVNMECKCGRGLPKIELKGGRVTDMIVLKGGKFVSGASLTIFLTANTPGVKKMQLIQEKLEDIVIRIVPKEDFGIMSKNYCITKAKELLGEKVNIDIELVQEIQSGESGKNRYCISKVDPFENF